MSQHEMVSELVSSRNITHMVGLVQELAEQSLHGDGMTAELKALLRGVNELVLEIENTLKAEHKDDETILASLKQCFTDAKGTLDHTLVSLQSDSESEQVAYKAFKDCRADVYSKYVTKIKKCEIYDNFIAELNFPGKIEQDCVWTHGDDKVVKHLTDGAAWYQTNAEMARTLRSACVAAVEDYEDADEECDSTQVDFENKVCTVRTKEWDACQDDFINECARCAKQFDKTVNEVECREKDRKVDWSSAQKIHCYVHVLLESPSDDVLNSSSCVDGTPEDCTSKWRLNKYKECESLCENVDYKNPDGYSVVDGVNSTHRHEDEEQEKRCTRVMDLSYPAQLGCEECPEVDPYPCLGAFEDQFYSNYIKTDWVHEIVEGTKECANHKHEEWSAYSMEDCHACPDLPESQQPKSDKCEIFGDEIEMVTTKEAADYIGFSWITINGGGPNEERPFKVVGRSGVWAGDQATWHQDHILKTSREWCSEKRTDQSKPSWIKLSLDEPTCIEELKLRSPWYGQNYAGGVVAKVFSKGVLTWTSAVVANQDTQVFEGEVKKKKVHQSGGWVKGPNGSNCGKVCSDINKQCNGAKPATLDTNEKVAAAFKEAGYTCKSFHGARDYDGTPFSKATSGDDCAPFSAGSSKQSSCSNNHYGHHSPLCYCD